MTVTITVRRVGNRGEYQASIFHASTSLPLYYFPPFHGRGAKAKAREAAETWCRENGHEVRKQ